MLVVSVKIASGLVSKVSLILSILNLIITKPKQRPNLPDLLD